MTLREFRDNRLVRGFVTALLWAVPSAFVALASSYLGDIRTDIRQLYQIEAKNGRQTQAVSAKVDVLTERVDATRKQQDDTVASLRGDIGRLFSYVDALNQRDRQ